MDFDFDLSIGRLVTTPGGKGVVREWEIKRGDLLPVRVRFWKEGAVVQLAGDWAITLGLKELFAGDFLAVAQGEDWEETEPSAGDFWYEAVLPTNTDEMLAWLAGGSYKVALGEISITDDDGGPISSQTLSVTVRNDVIKGDEGTPVEIPDASTWLSARAVRHDVAQSLTEAQRLQGRANVGLGSGTPVNEVVAWLEFDVDTQPDPGDTLTITYGEEQEVWDFVSGAPGGGEIEIAVELYDTAANIIAALGGGGSTIVNAVGGGGLNQVMLTPYAARGADGNNIEVTSTHAGLLGLGNLEGGVTATAGGVGSMKVNATHLHVVVSVDGEGVPTWKKVALSAL